MSGNSRSNARKSALLWAVGAVAALAIGVCAPLAAAAQSPATPPATPPANKPATPAKPSNEPPELWDPGDEVVPPKPLPTKPGQKPGTVKDGKGPAGSGDTQGQTDDGGPAWSVLLSTFVGDDHVEAANAARQRLASKIPQVADCFVRRVPQGSVLLVGRFNGPSDPAAQSKLKELKGLVIDGQRPFATVILTRTSTDAAPPGPNDLRRLREKFPTVKPLYTLQVAVWSTFGERTASRSDMRAAAEKYCKELRLKNVEAWVHHDDDTGTSSVLVGHFDSTAYDAKSTLFSPEVERLMKKFPRHLVNGEEVLIPVDPRRPDGQKRPQGCRLVEVPTF